MDDRLFLDDGTWLEMAVPNTIFDIRHAVRELESCVAPCSVSKMTVTGYTHDGTCSLHSDCCDTKQNWCVCEWAFETAVRKLGGDAFDLKCDATNRLALEHYERTGTTHAASCIRSKCVDVKTSEYRPHSTCNER